MTKGGKPAKLSKRSLSYKRYLNGGKKKAQAEDKTETKEEETKEEKENKVISLTPKSKTFTKKLTKKSDKSEKSSTVDKKENLNEIYKNYNVKVNFTQTYLKW